MRNKKVILIIIITLILLLLVFGSKIISINNTVNPSELAFQTIDVKNDKVIIVVDMISSGKNLKDYKYDIQGDTMYLSFYGKLVKNEPKDRLNFIIEEDMTKINEIILSGKSESKTIWKR